MYDNKLVVAVDIDDCLITPSVATGFPTDTPNYETIAVFKWFQAQGCLMVCWSGGGQDYAKMWADKLGLSPDYVWTKEANPYVDIALDDCDVKLGTVNVRVKRLNNSISRKDWNNHETYGSENN